MSLFIASITHWVYKWRNPKCNGKLPPGSMGFPLLGETIQFFIPSKSLDISDFIKKRMKSKQIYKLYNTFIEGSCGGLIPRVHPRILPHVYPHGIVPVKPHVTSFITAKTTFKASGDILSRPFALLSSPYLPDSLKSSLICETLVS